MYHYYLVITLYNIEWLKYVKLKAKESVQEEVNQEEGNKKFLGLTAAFEEFNQSYKDECKDLEICQIVDFLLLMQRDFNNDQMENNI